jgi:type IV secretory pathway TraG/TraD family ATPase VirD4
MAEAVHENRVIEGVGIGKHAFDMIYNLPAYYVTSSSADAAKPMLNFYASFLAGLISLQVFAWVARLAGATVFGAPALLFIDNPLNTIQQLGPYLFWAAHAGARALAAPVVAFAVALIILTRSRKAGKKAIERAKGYGAANHYDIGGSGYVDYTYDALKGYADKKGPPMGEITDPDGNIRYLWAEEDEHRLTIAPTGSGKTTRRVIPRILTINHSFLMLDIKGDGWSNCAGALIERGFEVVRISFSDLHPENGGVSLLQLIPKGSIYEKRFTDDLSEGITGGDASNAKSSMTEGFFANNAAAVISAMILFVIYTCSSTNQRLGYISSLLTPKKGETYKKLLERYATTPHDPMRTYNLKDAAGNPAVIHPDIYEPLMQIASAHEQTLQSIITTVQRYLRPFSNPLIDQAMSRTTFDVKNMHTRKIAVFIVIAMSSVRTLGPVTRTWCNFLYNYLMGDRARAKDEGTVDFIVDEADSLGKAPFLNSDLQVSRGARVFLDLYFQGRNQYLATFGDNQMIEAGCNLQTWLTPNDDKSARLISSRYGKLTWTYVREYDKDGKPIIATERRQALFEDEVYRTPLTHAHVFERGKSPKFIKLRPFFQDQYYVNLTKIPPPFDVTNEERARLMDPHGNDTAKRYYDDPLSEYTAAANRIATDLGVPA